MNTTPDPIDPTLESNLRALSTYTGEPTTLWQSALNQHTAARPTTHNKLKLTLTLLSAAAIIALAVGLLMPALSQVRVGKLVSVGRIALDVDGVDFSMRERNSASSQESAVERRRISQELDSQIRADKAYFPPNADKVAAESPDSPRSIIRKATIELAVPDARETFAKVQHLLRVDLGEFVEASTLTGESEPRGVSPGSSSTARAQLTLRVAASRLDEVLNTLRTFGKIDSENATGDDVSATVVDLDAHLRNERTVEAEVLKLLESRGGKDAQLKDILELREKLSSIRATIESLQGRRDTLGRQVSLATILVLLRPDNAPKPAPTPSSLFDAFNSQMSTAWTTGLATLTDTLAFLLRIAIGGLIWWLLLIATIAIARRLIRRLIPDPAAVPTTA